MPLNLLKEMFLLKPLQGSIYHLYLYSLESVVWMSDSSSPKPSFFLYYSPIYYTPTHSLLTDQRCCLDLSKPCQFSNFSGTKSLHLTLIFCSLRVVKIMYSHRMHLLKSAFRLPYSSLESPLTRMDHLIDISNMNVTDSYWNKLF